MTSPTTNESASNVMRLMVSPKSGMKAKVAIKMMGNPAMVMSVLRISRKKRNTTIRAAIEAKMSSSSELITDSRTDTDWSRGMM